MFYWCIKKFPFPESHYWLISVSILEFDLLLQKIKNSYILELGKGAYEVGYRWSSFRSCIKALFSYLWWPVYIHSHLSRKNICLVSQTFETYSCTYQKNNLRLFSGYNFLTLLNTIYKVTQGYSLFLVCVRNQIHFTIQTRFPSPLMKCWRIEINWSLYCTLLFPFVFIIRKTSILCYSFFLRNIGVVLLAVAYIHWV